MSDRGAVEDTESTRPSAGEILGRVIEDAEDEISRPPSALAISGFAAGLLMGLTPTAVGAVGAALGSGQGWREVVAFLAYPLGFIAVIIGRAQLFTENTLYPVVLVLDRRRHLLKTLRLWAIVLTANICGVLVFAAIAARTSALPKPIEAHVVTLGQNALLGDWTSHFWTGVIGGWLIALVAWLVEATGDSIAHLAIIWILTFVVGIGHFAHSIATATEILTAVIDDSAKTTSFLSWFSAAVLGNTAGGVVIVALLNYGQVMAGRRRERRDAFG